MLTRALTDWHNGKRKVIIRAFREPACSSQRTRKCTPLKCPLMAGFTALTRTRLRYPGLAVVDDDETAVEMADEHGLGIVTIH